MMIRRAALRYLLSLTASVWLVGCAVSDTSRYYALGHFASGNAVSPPGTSAGTTTVAIGVGPVFVPGYLDRLQIVTRTATDQVEFSMFHRWAEPLEDGIARTLTEELASRVPTEHIVTYPWRGMVARNIQYQVVIAVLRFDGRQGGDVVLDTRWRILGGDGKELVLRRTTVTETAAGPGYEPMVAALARGLAAVGQEMAAEIRTLPR